MIRNPTHEHIDGVIAFDCHTGVDVIHIQSDIKMRPTIFIFPKEGDMIGKQESQAG